MIGLFVKIPFHSQLRRAEADLAAKLEQSLHRIRQAFAGKTLASDESFFVYFDDESRTSRLRAAEAARELALELRGLQKELHGWTIVLDTGADQAEAGLDRAKRLWYRLPGDGLYISAAAQKAFAAYFSYGPRVDDCAEIIAAPYADPVLPIDDLESEPTGGGFDRLVDEVEQLGLGQSSTEALALVGPDRETRLCLETALKKLYKVPASDFLRFQPSAVAEGPYLPLAQALGPFAAHAQKNAEGTAPLTTRTEDRLLDGLAPMLDLIARSPYRSVYSESIGIRLRILCAAALSLYIKEQQRRGLPPFVILESIQDIPEESLAAFFDSLAETKTETGVLVLATGTALPPSWPAQWRRSVGVSGPGPAAVARLARQSAEALDNADLAADIAGLSAGDSLRLRLIIRLAACGRLPKQELSLDKLSCRVFSTLPPEYAEYFLALRLSEGILTNMEMTAFLESCGFSEGLRPLITEGLATLGLVLPGERPRIVSREAASKIETCIDDQGAAVVNAFHARLVSLHRSQAILPSRALYRHIMKDRDREADGGEALKFLLDCVSADCLYGPSEPASTKALAHPLAATGDFLTAYAANDRNRSLAVLEELEAGLSIAEADGMTRAVSLNTQSLARASAEYAERRAQDAASKAKAALIGFHSLGFGRFEARAHRLLGLCSLAQGQALEAADYFSNAWEIAQAAPDPLVCILSAQAETAAHFVLGDMRRAMRANERVLAWSLRSFRPDWESAARFIAGRLALELGRSAEAEDCFGQVRAQARIYGQEEAAFRAEVWTGRAASWAGETERARDMFSRADQDAEALWFLAELEARQGDMVRALGLAEKALTLLPRRGFDAADYFSWDSGFEELEGRCVGYTAERGYLEDQILAFTDYCAGMSEGGEAGFERSALLARRAREERLGLLHPGAHLYLFYRYLLLEILSPGSTDSSTALSKAFKAMQTRSARMDETGIKDDFLQKNPWNRQLLAKAKAHKLF